MAYVPVPDGIQANLRLSYDGQEVENVLNFKAPATPTPADLAAVAEGVEDWWIANLVSIVPPSVVYREVYAVDLSNQFGGVFTASGGNGTAGANAFPALPNNVTLAVSLRTAQRGRSYRGRIYHIGLTEPQVTNNEVVPTIITLLNAAYAALLNSANFGGCELAVVSRQINNAPRILGIATPVIDTVIADPVVDSQRRRLPGRGR